MENAIVITPKVISRMCNMSIEDQKAVMETLICEEILNTDRAHQLSPMQELCYLFMRDYIRRDSLRYNRAYKEESPQA